MKAGTRMKNSLTLWQKIRLYISEIPYMDKPLNEVEDFFEKISNWLSGLSDGFDDTLLFIRYIILLFLLTSLFIGLKISYRYIWNLIHAKNTHFYSPKSEDFWKRYHTYDEIQSLREIRDIFKDAKKEKTTKFLPPQGGITSIFCHIMTGLNAGMTDLQIIKTLPPNISMMDVLPLMEAVRGFRDLAASKIIDAHTKNKERILYDKALRNLSDGNPHLASKLMQKELVHQQRILFGLKDKLLQQYARKEASALSLQLALILGVYDTRLADKAYQKSMELLPKDSKNKILYGRFRQLHFGNQDKIMEKTFLKLAKNVDKTIQNYMLNYAIEMTRRAEIRNRQEEIKARIQDEKERYNEAVHIERLKIREALKMARMRNIENEARSR